MESKEEIIKKILNKNIENLTTLSIIVNNNEPFFSNDDYNIVEGIPNYFEPDELGRTSGAIAIVSKYTLSIQTEKHLKYPDPYGWTKEIKEKGIFQRCHCIAYRLSAKKNNKKNIFIGTIDLNKKIMNEVENKIEIYIRKNKKKNIRILYRVTPQYKSKNQIPTGILIEAKSLDSDFSQCIFCFNVQEKVKFDYKDGTIIKDSRGIKKTVQKIKNSYIETQQNSEKNIDLVINSQTKKYHLENCSMLKDIDPKYIKEIKTKEKHLKKNGYFPCKICNK